MEKAFIVVGMGFGDEGKGETVNKLTNKYNSDLIVRYNGGSQAGHNVRQNGLHHCFSQIGSGSFNANAKTILSKYMLVDPIALINEANIFNKKLSGNILERIYISENARMITPYNVFSNKYIENRRVQKHGTCGKGIGDTVKYNINYPQDGVVIKDLNNKDLLNSKLTLMELRKSKYLNKNNRNEYFYKLIDIYDDIKNKINIVSDNQISSMITDSKTVIFEGAQGVLLDEEWGFAPHTTWSDITPNNALRMVDTDKTEIIGIIRTYYTRHGVGYFPSEMKIDLGNKIEDNIYNKWQGYFRIGAFDGNLFEYACDVVKPDKIVVTHQDMFDNCDKLPVMIDNNIFNMGEKELMELINSISKVCIL